MWKRISVILLGCVIISSCATPRVDAPETRTDVPEVGDATQVPATVEVNLLTPTSTTSAVASATRFVVPTSTPSNVDAGDATAIAATMMAQMPPTTTPDASGLSSSLQGETALLGLRDRYVAAITLGMMENFNDPHPLTIYEKVGTEFTVVATYAFADEYISTLEPIPVATSDKAFFAVSGGVGAHSSFAKIFSFDGTTLKVEVETGSDAGGGALKLVDANKDGQIDVIGDSTDYYVFCYACGVRIQGETIYAWNGTAFVEQTLQDSSDATLQRAIVYARAQRYADAAKQLSQVKPPTALADQWNVVLIERMIALRQPSREDPYPFLSAIFFGDYDAAVKMMRGYDAAELVNPTGRFFANTPADGFVDAVVWNVVGFTTLALEQDADLTSARFLRGWANTLLDPRNPAGIADLQAVADQDAFYAAIRDAVVAR